MRKTKCEVPKFENLGLTHLCNPVWIYDVECYRLYWANSAAVSLWEAEDLQELVSRDFRPGSSEAIQHTLEGYLREFANGKIIDRWWRISPKGIDKHVLCRFSGVYIEDNRLAMMVEAHSSDLIEHFAQSSSTASIIGMFDIHGDLCSSNPLFVEQFGESVTRFEHLFNDQFCLQGIISLDEEQTVEKDVLLQTRQEPRWHKVEIKSQTSGSIDDRDIIVTMIDIHERKLKEIKIRQESLSDPLTKLVNRRGLYKHLNRLSDTMFTLYYIDLDGFKPINDNYGHAAGDFVLKETARQLKQQIHPMAFAARLGGDEFIIIIPEALSEEQVGEIAERMLLQICQPIDIPDQNSVSVSASIGAVKFPEDGKGLDDLIACADSAMFSAKKQGKSAWVRYSPGMEEMIYRRTGLLQDIGSAINGNHLVLEYQPIVNLNLDKVVAVEANLVWQHNKFGLIKAGEAVKVAEDSGNIAALESWVISQTCLDMGKLRKIYNQDCRVSVNFTGSHIINTNFVSILESILYSCQLSSKDIWVEISEDILVALYKGEQDTLEQLCKAGFDIIVDNFCGQSGSLPVLSSLPVSYIKLDSTFLEHLGSNKSMLCCLQSIAKNNDCQCIANGVVSEEAKSTLAELNISLQQGELFGKAKPLSALECQHKSKEK